MKLFKSSRRCPNRWQKKIQVRWVSGRGFSGTPVFKQIVVGYMYIRALASARGSVARRAQRPSRKPLEGPKGPRVAKTRESEGPKGPRTSKAQSALASATICFSRFSQKSRFSWHNLSTFTTAKMHENFNRVSYLRYKHRVKKLKQFVDQNKSYARLKFCKIVVFVSKRGRYIYYMF